MVSIKYVAAGGLGVVGVPAAGYGIWSAYGGGGAQVSVEDLDKRLKEQNYSARSNDSFQSPASSMILKGADNNTFSFDSFAAGECFKRFFPEVEVAFASGGSAGSMPTIDGPSDSNKSSSSKTVGCTSMQLSRDGNSGKFAFVSETTAKNDKVGWVIWFGAKNESKTTGNSRNVTFQYRLLLLEKNGQSKWTVKGGILWDDVATSTASGSKVRIVSPSGNINQSFGLLSSSDTASGTWSHEKYAGVWESGSSGEEVFEKVQVTYTDTDDRIFYFVLGKPENLGTNWGSGFYNVGEKKWVTLSSGENNGREDVSNTLNAWYAPFKGTRGK